MGQEIERKFLVKNDAWRTVPGTRYRQGYLSVDIERVVRVRTVGSTGFLTIKGINIGAARAEFEYEIPVDEANEMLDTLCQKPLIEKSRTIVEYKGLVWEIDNFLGENAGLIVAEVELQSEDQLFEKPDWVGEEVTEDPRYYNSNLTIRPFTKW